MELLPQFPDLTEVKDLYYESNFAPEKIRALKTEFAFAVTGPNSNIAENRLMHVGFKAISQMNNWWSSHAGESRCLTFYWKKWDRPNLQGSVERVTWQNQKYIKGEILSSLPPYGHLASGGCGLKLLENFLSKKHAYRFFTLQRMPLEPTALQLKKLASLNYRLVDSGKLASYWINGWDPDTYDVKKEYEFFGTTKEIWGGKGHDWNSYEERQETPTK
jgi:hypothetical protein